MPRVRSCMTGPGESPAGAPPTTVTWEEAPGEIRRTADARRRDGPGVVVVGIAVVSLRYDAAVSRAARGSSS